MDKYSSTRDLDFFSISSKGNSLGVADDGRLSDDRSLLGGSRLRLDSRLWFLDPTGVLLPLALRGAPIFLQGDCSD
jgi:hypothetical protein